MVSPTRPDDTFSVITGVTVKVTEPLVSAADVVTVTEYAPLGLRGTENEVEMRLPLASTLPVTTLVPPKLTV